MEIYNYLFNFHYFTYNENQESLNVEYKLGLKESIEIKERLNRIIGPNLANPYYQNELNDIINKESERSTKILSDTNEKQFNSIDLAEKIGFEFYIKCVSNFEAFLMLFDSFILAEDFISMDGKNFNKKYLDDDLFTERKDYNFLMKLKPDYKPNLNLNNKKTYKKIYLGLDKNLLKINYYDKFYDVSKKIIESIYFFIKIKIR